MTRPTGDELQAMSDRDFDRFLRRSGIAVARPGWSHRLPVLRTALTAAVLLLIVAVPLIYLYLWIA